MGMLDDIFGTKKKTTDKFSKTSTMTPNIPDWIEGPTHNYLSKVNSQINVSPYSLVEGANHLQTQAYNDATSMGDWKGGNQQAQSLALSAAGAKPNFANLITAPRVSLGDANTYQAATAAPMDLTKLAQASGSGYNASQADTVDMGDADQAEAERASYRSFLEGGLDPYMNPNIENVVDTTLADMDENAGRVRAAQMAAGARNKALGGSRFGVAQGITEGELGRARATADAQLRSNAYESAVRGAQFDTNNWMDNSKFNANLGTQTNLANTGFRNQREEAQGTMDANIGMFNTGQENEAAAFGANAGNQASMFNAGQSNQGMFKNADLGMFNAGQQNAAGQFNTGQQNQFALNQGQMDASLGMFNAGAANQGMQFNAGQRDAALNRQMQGAGLLGDLSNNQANNVRADLGVQNEIGQDQWQRDQMRRMAPWTQIGLHGDALGKMPLGMFAGRTETSSGRGSETQTDRGSMFDIAMSLGSILASDRRLKADIEPVGKAKGHNVYRYRYIGEDRARLGVMADEVEKIVPEAVVEHPNGYKMVNYTMLGLEALTEV